MNQNRFAARGIAIVGGALTLALILGGCGSDPTPAGNGKSKSPAASSGTETTPAAEECPTGSLSGEGSSAQKNVVEEVITAYQAKCDGVNVTYNATSSGDGIKNFNAKQVDWAGSDSALKTEEKDGIIEVDAAKQRCGGNEAWNLPMVVGPISVAYNVEGVDKLVLNADVIAKIFSGGIKKWNDKAIAKLNAGVTLPDAPIAVFYRSDSSGTTENFTKYLKAAAPTAWKKEPAKEWTGVGSGKEKSAGVAEGVKTTKNGITYVEMSYAKDNGLSIAQVDNGSGPIELTPESAAKGVASAEVSGTGNDLRLKLDYATKDAGAYPIVLVTYEVVCSKGLDAAKVAPLKAFLGFFASTEGQAIFETVGYAPLPEEIRAKVETAVQAIS